MPHKKASSDIDQIISEIQSLKNDVSEFRSTIQKMKEAPHEKNAETVGSQHNELITELEDIANTLENLPEKWESKG